MKLQTWKRHILHGTIAGGVFFLVLGILNGVALYWGSFKYFQGIAPGGALPPEAKTELAHGAPVMLLAYLYDTGFGLFLGALWGALVGLVQALRDKEGAPQRFQRPAVSARGSMLAFHMASFPPYVFLGLVIFSLTIKGYLKGRPGTGELVAWVVLLTLVYLALAWGLYRALTPLFRRLARVSALRSLARPRVGLTLLAGLSLLIAVVSLVPPLLAPAPGAAGRTGGVPATSGNAGAGRSTGPGPGSSATSVSGKSPNVLLLVLDTTRADHLSCYGYPKPTTPNLDRFAREGVLYEQAYSPAVWTLAGHAAIFTGQYPSRSGADGEHPYLDPATTTLAEALAAGGYRTEGFCNNAWVSDWTGLSQGFEHVRQVWTKPYNSQLILAAMSIQFFQFATTGNLPFGGVIKTSEEVLSWIDHLPRDEKPFFCFVNYMEAHPPLEYRPRFTEPFRPPDLTRQKVARVNQNPYAIWARKQTMSADDSRAYATLYDGELNYLDTYLQDLFDGLRTRGLLDDTIVIITADHGEALGEHGDLGHRLHFWQGVLHVPLIVRYPKAFPAGGRVREPVQTVDIFPTVLSLAGLHDPAILANLQGRPLPPVGQADPGRVVFAEEMRPLLELGFIRAMRPAFDVAKEYDRTHRAVIAGRMKYVWSSDQKYELYDLAADPGENRNLYSERPEDARPLDDALQAWLASFTPYDVGGAGYSFRPPDRQTLDQLKALGYVQ